MTKKELIQEIERWHDDMPICISIEEYPHFREIDNIEVDEIIRFNPKLKQNTKQPVILIKA